MIRLFPASVWSVKMISEVSNIFMTRFVGVMKNLWCCRLCCKNIESNDDILTINISSECFVFISVAEYLLFWLRSRIDPGKRMNSILRSVHFLLHSSKVTQAEYRPLSNSRFNSKHCKEVSEVIPYGFWLSRKPKCVLRDKSFGRPWWNSYPK